MFTCAMPEAYPTSGNEPRVPPFLRRSFVFLPSTGMRHAPEVLVLELMREVFFEKHFGAVANRPLDPWAPEAAASPPFTDGELAVVALARGRRKSTQQSREGIFYAPAYPPLARDAWLGKNRERVILGLLFEGAIAQHLWGRGADVEERHQEQESIAASLVEALAGHRTPASNEAPGGKEMLAIAVGAVRLEHELEAARKRVLAHTSTRESVFRCEGDVLATHVVADLRAICQLDERLPRMQWLGVLMTFLRFSLSMWVLAQMRLTVLLHTWAIRAMDEQAVPLERDVMAAIARRNLGLLHPTLTPTREIYEHIDRYIRARVELSILVYNLQEFDGPDSPARLLSGRALGTLGARADHVPVWTFVEACRKNANRLRASSRFAAGPVGQTAATFLAREAEGFSAWRAPRGRGQGKNIDEFLRVLYKAAEGDEAGGSLLVSEGRGITRGFRVFPGQELLRTVAYLAAAGRRTAATRERMPSRLVLSDLEAHFRDYGVDFQSAADARPALIQQLQALGLLIGSPDAGSSVEVGCPY